MTIKIFPLFISGIIAYLLVALVATRYSTPSSGPLVVKRFQALPAAGSKISLVTWNLGYGGLGAKSDFKADGGKTYLPPSQNYVRDNLRAIKKVIGKLDACVFLFQEVATSSPINYWVDVDQGISEQLAAFDKVRDLDVATVFLPPPLKVAHGNTIFSSFKIEAARRQVLPLEQEWHAGVLRKKYSIQIARIPIAGSKAQWVIANVHLAAFDEGGAVRLKQLESVQRWADKEYQHGNFVIVGGDWNLEFSKDTFPHTTDYKHRFWLYDFPFKKLLPGWQVAFDPSKPTVRTLHQPYVRGKNYVTVIDGFLVSPNLTIEAVETINTDFENTDHQPVVARFQRK